MRRSLEELAANAEALADQFENYIPTAEDAERPLPPILAVRLASYRRDTAEAELAQAVSHAREENVSWRQLGEAIGTSGEAARQRYSKTSA